MKLLVGIVLGILGVIAVIAFFCWRLWKGMNNAYKTDDPNHKG